MSGFSTEWLSLREPYDRAARNRTVLKALAAAFSDRPGLRVVDLACGTGATLRAIAGQLPTPQHWRFVDNDLGHLARAATAADSPRVRVVAKPLDLVRDLELALEQPLDLITASALLDLVSPEWLDRLIIEAASRRLPIYAALTYDGFVAWEPAGDLDAELVRAFNLHQQTDKGFGPALGPRAAARTIERLQHFGFSVVHGRSDWVLGPADWALQEWLLAGWAEAAMLTLTQIEIGRWLTRRRFDLSCGRSRVRVGHLDIFARPIGSR